MATANLEALDAMLAKLEPAACVAFFKGMPEAERKLYAERVLHWYDVSRLHHEEELRFWNAVFIKEAPKRVQKLWNDREGAKLAAKLMPSQVTKEEAISISLLAALATSTLTEIKKRRRTPVHLESNQILADRKPKWLPEYCQWLLEEWTGLHWPAVRLLEKEGIVSPEISSAYLRGMIWTVDEKTLREDPELLEHVWQMIGDDQSMRTLMMTVDSSLSRRAFDANFSDGWKVLNSAPVKWRQILVSLGLDGTLDRNRLISELMSVFVRFNLEHSDSKSSLVETWFFELHGGLQLSGMEELALCSDYLRLLSCRNPKVLDWTLKRIDKLIDETGFDSVAVLESIPLVFLVKGKDHAVEALKLLRRIGDTDKQLKKVVAYGTAQALSSESQDIQKRAIIQLEKLQYKDDPLCEMIRDKIDGIGALHRERVLLFVGGSPEPTALPETVSKVVSIPRGQRQIDQRFQSLFPDDPLAPLNLRGDQYPRLIPGNELPVLNSLDDVIFMCSQILHGQWNERFSGDDIEILLDGIARFGHERPSDFDSRIAAIRTETLKYGGINWGVGPLKALIYVWLVSAVPFTQVTTGIIGKLFGFSLEDELRDRLVYVGERASKEKATVLLSTPTHKGGWIDPLVLIDRVRQASLPESSPGGAKKLFGDFLSTIGLTLDKAVVGDQSLSLLRLAPDNRSEALRKLESLNLPKSEFVDAFRYALGASNVRVGDNARLWVAAARARSPFADDLDVDAKHRGTGPDGALLAKYRIVYLTKPPIETKKPTHLVFNQESTFRLLNVTPDLPADSKLVGMYTVLRHKVKIVAYSMTRFTDWERSVWPMNNDAFFRLGIERMVSHEGNDPVGREQKVFLEALYDPDLPVSHLGLLMLVLACASKQKDEHQLGIEALIAVLEDGRIDGKQLGAMMNELLHANALRTKAGYWQADSYPPLISVTRWAKALRPVSQTSSFHAYMVALALQEAFQGDCTLAPKDVGQLVEVYSEVLMETGDEIQSEATRSYLNGLMTFQPTSKTGKLCKQILSMKRAGKYDSKISEIIQYSLDRRCDRSDRWVTAIKEPVTVQL